VAYLHAGLPFHVLPAGLQPGWLGNGDFLPQFALALLPGFLWLGFVRSRRPGASAYSLLQALALIAVLLALLLGLDYYRAGQVGPRAAAGLLAGFALGGVGGWLAGPSLTRWLRYRRELFPLLWKLAVAGGLAWALLPLDGGMLLSDPGFTGLELPTQFYRFIKAAMPWAGLGVVCGLGGYGRNVRVWSLATVTGFGLCLWFALDVLQLGEVAQVLAAIPGLAFGLWLGEHTAQPAPLQSGRRGAASQIQGRYEQPAVAAQAEIPPFELTPQSPQDQPAARHATSHAFSPQRQPSTPKPEPANEAGEEIHAPPVTGWSLLAGRALGLILLLSVAAILFDFPKWPLAIALGLAVYAGVLWVRPLTWLVVVPAALPLLDLAPWTGRFFFDEFDLLMLVTAGGLLLMGRRAFPVGAPLGANGRGFAPKGAPTDYAALRSPQACRKRPARFPRMAGPLIALLCLSALISGVLGLLPLPPLNANAFSSYWSPYNSLRVAKGFLWGGLIFLWIRRAQPDRRVLARLFAFGMGLGLAGVGAIGAWEHGLFVGFGHETYRIVSTFSSMHTGGGHIEAYLVAALPFLWLATTKLRHLAVTGPFTILTAYVMLYTVARGGVLALGLAVLILLLASGRLALLAGGRRLLAPLGMLVVVGLLLAAGMGEGYLQKRFAASAEDWQTRVDHWSRALDMMDGSVSAQLFGMGLGSFPRVYLDRGPADKQPASFGFAAEQGNSYFRLGAGATVYYAQRVPFSAGRGYRLELNARSRQGDARLDTPVCEKQMLNSRQCAWMDFSVPGDGQWHKLTRDFSSAEVGAQGWMHRPPVELFFYNPGKAGVLDIDNVRLIDPDGRNVLCNGDFSRGGDCWYFKTHSHLPWHIKNVWVHVLFEQGWLGLLAFAGLTALALTRLARAGWQGHRLAWAWLASLTGLLTVGTFDSLLDAPRLATLLLAFMLLGAGYDWEPSAGAASRRQRSRFPSSPTGSRV
jgi:hypothetical protein